jgi:lysozyme family protein
MGFWDWLFRRNPAPVVPIKPPATPPSYPARFLECLQYTFKNEGGFSDHPNDKGGPTNFGITQADLSRWRGYQVSASAVRAMPKSEAEAIYFAFYWKPLSLDRILDRKLTLMAFDLGIWGGLTGVSRIVRLALGYQEHAFDDAANFLQCMDRLNQADPIALTMKMADFCEATRRARVQREPNQKTFLLGWLRRVNRHRKELGDGSERPIEAWIYEAAGYKAPRA